MRLDERKIPAKSRRNLLREKAFRRFDLVMQESLSSPPTQRIASNFAILGMAEVMCRGISVLLTISLYHRLGPAGFGRIEFAFNLVFWLVLIVRDCFETIVTREIARHPRITRGFVNHVLAVKLILATALTGLLVIVGRFGFQSAVDGRILSLYGLLLLTTALGLDFVFRATESVGLVAISLVLRTSIYCSGVWFLVHDASRILLVPACLAVGEFCGIALVWAVYAARFGVPQLTLGGRFSLVLLDRGRAFGLIHLCQAILVSIDLLVVGVMNGWIDVGRYGGPHRMISAVMAFGLIFQQVVFPALSRSWRTSTEDGKRLFDLSVRVLMTGFIPVAIGGSLLAEPLVRFLFPSDYERSILLLGIGIWRAPLLCLTFLYQSSLIAMNRESAGLRLLSWGAIVAAPLAVLLQWSFGLIGASVSVLIVAMGLVSAGYFSLAKEGRAPAFHHHIGLPLLASLGMIPVCLLGLRIHVVLAVAVGGIVYLAILKCLGGLNFRLKELGTARVETHSPGKFSRR